jgi:hypothetical protein
MVSLGWAMVWGNMAIDGAILDFIGLIKGNSGLCPISLFF